MGPWDWPFSSPFILPLPTLLWLPRLPAPHLSGGWAPRGLRLGSPPFTSSQQLDCRVSMGPGTLRKYVKVREGDVKVV